MKTMLSGLTLCSGLICLGGVMAAHAQPGPPPAGPPKPDTAEATAHVAAARAAAGTQWKEAADFFCTPTPNRANSPTDPLLAPTKIFDNLYVIGRAGTAVYVVSTSEGLVMIDAGYPDQLDSVLLSGFAALGLDPANVKYNIVGHGHVDHVGGTPYFQEKYKTRVVMGAADWDMLENSPPGGRGPLPVNRPKRDIAVNDGQVVTVGDTRFTIVGTPGHTPGSIGIIFPVKDGATTHTAALYGGTVLMPAVVPEGGLPTYLRSLNRFAEVTKRMNVDVEIQNHPLYDGIEQKIAGVRAGKKGVEHPFVVGTKGYQQFVTVMSECIQAQMIRRATAAQ